MILLVAGRQDLRSMDALLALAAQLDACGHSVAIDEAALPPDAERNMRYEAARFLTDPDACVPDAVLCLATTSPDAETLMRFRRMKLAPEALLALVGRFADLQARISAEAGLTFAFGRAPRVVDLGVLGPKPLSGSALGLTHAMRRVAGCENDPPTLGVFLSREVVAQPETLPVLSMIHHGRKVRLVTIGDGATQEAIRNSRHVELEVYRHSDLSALAMAGMLDAAALYRDDAPGDRLGMLLTTLLACGKPVIDGTAAQTLLATGAPVLQGPSTLGALPAFLEATLLPHWQAIAARIHASRWVADADIARLEGELGLVRPPAVPQSLSTPRTMFLPTNGVGLGHARRSALIAASPHIGAEVGFAAFSSCVPMIRSAGFPCLPLISRDDEHGQPWANDLVNYLRLGRAFGRGDKLVFDGGYVFNSILRTIVDHDLLAVWIRRGLWQPAQTGARAIDREALFRRVIVPDEAFAELNDDMSYGAKVVRVGPIVDRVAAPGAAAALRARLVEQTGRRFTSLVVTMLGAGVAADRTAQTMALCTMMERRSDVLHLIVVWPGARIPPGLGGWTASRVVQTLSASTLMQAADLVVSASGYNSFHEVLYHRVPAIFVPQMAAFMDDQSRRARAAADRDLALTVGGHELLALEQGVSAMLDDGLAAAIRVRLGAETLPEIGTDAAARIIAEVAR